MSRSEMSVTDFGAYAAEIAAHLPEAWAISNTDADGLPAHWARLTRERDGLKISVTHSGWKGRLSVAPELPPDECGGRQSLRYALTYDERQELGGYAIEATYALGRPAVAVARDIMRRVVEPYAAIYPRIVERTCERRIARDRYLAQCRRLCDRYGQEVRDRDAGSSSVTVWPGSGSSLVRTIEVRDCGTAELKLDSLPFDRLEAVLDVLDRLGRGQRPALWSEPGPELAAAE